MEWSAIRRNAMQCYAMLFPFFFSPPFFPLRPTSKNALDAPISSMSVFCGSSSTWKRDSSMFRMETFWAGLEQGPM